MVLYESSHGAGNASEDEQKENKKVLDKMKST